MKLTKPELHPSLRREPIKLKRVDWAKFEDYNYRGIENAQSDRTDSIWLARYADVSELDDA